MIDEINVITVLVAGCSLFVSLAAFRHSVASTKVANAISESQKTSALLSLVAPASDNPQAWALINYLSKNDRLPAFSKEDEILLRDLLARLSIKCTIVGNKLKTTS